MDHQSTRTDWWYRAACRTESTELFYAERGQDTRPAKRICITCPVQAECLNWALRHEIVGIWAGTSPKQRRALRRARSMSVNRIETDPSVAPMSHSSRSLTETGKRQ